MFSSLASIGSSSSSWTDSNPLQVLSYSAASDTVVILLQKSATENTLAFLASSDIGFINDDLWSCVNYNEYCGNKGSLVLNIVTSASIAPAANSLIVSTFPSDSWVKIVNDSISCAICIRKIGRLQEFVHQEIKTLFYALGKTVTAATVVSATYNCIMLISAVNSSHRCRSYYYCATTIAGCFYRLYYCCCICCCCAAFTAAVAAFTADAV